MRSYVLFRVIILLLRFRSKLLAKMGFTGRLGKQSSGVTRQIEVKLRPQGIGLGFGNFKESSTLRINREIEADRTGVSMKEEDRGMYDACSNIIV